MTYKICIHTCDFNGDFILYFILREKWPLSRRRQLEFGLEFERNGFDERHIFSEGFCKSIRDDKWIEMAGDGLFAELNI